MSALLTLCKKRASETTIDSCEPPHGCWELILVPPEDQQELLTSKPSLQPWLLSS